MTNPMIDAMTTAVVLTQPRFCGRSRIVARFKPAAAPPADLGCPFPIVPNSISDKKNQEPKIQEPKRDLFLLFSVLRFFGSSVLGISFTRLRLPTPGPSPSARPLQPELSR